MSNPNRPKSKLIASYIDCMPPCNNICPAGENIQKWLGLAKEEKFKEAWETIVENNPFPAIHGRVCYHYCETKCNRAQFDETVGIHCAELFLGDMALQEKWSMSCGTATKKKVLIVGAGPAGLSAAYHLRLFGHEVTIHEALPKAGGMMQFGIPAYRLPRETLAGEIDRILNMGVEIKYNHKVTDILDEKKQGGFDAVFLAVGAHLGRTLALPTENPCQITDAADYLNKVALGKAPNIGPRLTIYGGGNTAVDVARTAKRLGLSDITIIYHRTREKMAAFPHEIKEALDEGIKFEFLRTVVSLNQNSLTLSINELDEKCRPQQTGKTQEIQTDTMVFALGQTTESEFLCKIPEIEIQNTGIVIVDDSFMTGCDGVFAGGDMIPYDRSVTVATGHGKQAARNINAYLNGKLFNRPPRHKMAYYENLRINEEKSAKTKQKLIDAETRICSFAEITKGYNKNEAVYEAKRCFSCGNCFECDACYNVCPVEAITKLGPGKRYEIDTNKCIGCSKCFKSCPCGAIIMTNR